ncbi:hypothetical protein JXM67_10925 [candidate division WOR-3 bacterium]|nr:hypothetical protein [candidate division WOR-3 bacterium]
MKKIGYLEGTDPTLLAKLVMAGHGTLPLGNGWDNHGKYINHLSKEDKVDAVVGYLHKVFPPDKAVQGPGDMLFACRAHKIPVYLLVSKEDLSKAKACLKTIGKGVKLVDPVEAFGVLTGKVK